jgi:hypothetical protein
MRNVYLVSTWVRRDHTDRTEETKIENDSIRISYSILYIYLFISFFFIYLLLQLGCHPVAVHIYTQALHRTTQITTDNTNNNIRTTQIQTNVVECGPCSVFASFTLAFALQLRKKHEKISVSYDEH